MVLRGSDNMADLKDAEGVLLFAAYAPFTFSPPFWCFLQWGKNDFVYLIATMPGLHSGGQVYKVENAAPF